MENKLGQNGEDQNKKLSREQRWKIARMYLVTASAGSKILSKGTKGKQWGAEAIGYLYEKKYEIRTGKPIRSESNRNFSWGHEQEEMGYEWMKENTMYSILHCSSESDFPDDIYFKTGVIPDMGDSPDLLIDDDAVGEIKCLVSQKKFEAMRSMTKADVVDEYREQFAIHLMHHPDRDKLIYLVYDGQSDEDELDTTSPLDPSRGIIWTFHRSEFEGLIEETKERVRIGMAAVRRSLETGEKIEQILNG